MSSIQYEDHIGLWEKELKSWVPKKIFDAHVHLGPPEAMGKISPERLKLPLTTFTNLDLEGLKSWHEELYSGKRVKGFIAFPFPFREVALEAANRYIMNIMQERPEIKGFILSHPKDTRETIKHFEEGLKYGVRFFGVKPYFDLLGKSNYEVTMPEFIPADLLEFMNAEHLILMLHTSGIGMGEKANQEFVMSIADGFPRIKIILAHFGRYLKLRHFSAFLKSDVLDYPSIFLEMSSVTQTEIYEMALNRRSLWPRVLFGSDMPYGVITGMEFYEGKTPTFVTRNHYPWSIAKDSGRNDVTYNTYHVIKALKDALANLRLNEEQLEELKTGIFLRNATHNLLNQ